MARAVPTKADAAITRNVLSSWRFLLLEIVGSPLFPGEAIIDRGCSLS